MDTKFNNRINSLNRRLYYISDNTQLQIRINYLNYVISLLNEKIDKNILNYINNSRIFLQKIIDQLSIPENQQLLYNNLKTIYNTNLNKYNGIMKIYNTNLKDYNNKIITELDLLYKFYTDPLTPETSIDNKLKVNIIKFLLDYLKQYSNYDLEKIDPINIFSQYYYININDYMKYMNEETFYIILNDVIKNKLPQLILNLELLLSQLQKYPITDIKFEFENLLMLYNNPKLLSELQKNIKNEIDNEIKLNYLTYQSTDCLMNNCFNQLLIKFENDFINNDKFKKNMINNFNKSKNATYNFKFSNSKIMNKISSKCQNCLLADMIISWNKKQKNIEILEIINNMVVSKININIDTSIIDINIINIILNTIYTKLSNQYLQRSNINKQLLSL